MAKRFRLSTRAFGAEPGPVDVTGLAEWVAQHRGRLADLTTYRLDAPLALQAGTGIATPCAGGRFYDGRILAALTGIEERVATAELHVDTRDVIEDAAGIVLARKGAWCAMPSPRLLGITDRYFHDTVEWNDAICGAYRTILRAMRDTGVAGHVLVCDSPDTDELAALAWQKVFFFVTEPSRDSLALLLERQQQVAVRKDHLPVLFSLMDEYEIRRLFLLDPDPASVASALVHFDKDRIIAAGYCTDGNKDYWKELAASAEYMI